MTKLNSLLIADSIREEKNGKILFVGVYADVALDEKPEPADAYVFMSLEDMTVGTHSLEIKIIDRTLKRAAGGPPMEIHVEDEDETQIQIVQLPNFHFPSSGVYAVIVEIDQIQVGMTEFRLTFPESDDPNDDMQD